MAESNGCGADKRRSGQDSAGDIVLYSLGRYGKQPVSGGRRIGEQVELRASSAFTGMVGLSSDRGFTGGERRYRRVQQRWRYSIRWVFRAICWPVIPRTAVISVVSVIMNLT